MKYCISIHRYTVINSFMERSHAYGVQAGLIQRENRAHGPHYV